MKKNLYKLHLKRLDLFGSATTEQFGSDSDVDIIVEFKKKEIDIFFNNCFALKEQL
ncbi:MAG: nucleotidyltransferase domain-containing protein [Candidatus Omnitrophica bacterium]|nr:nucleotidyltransferase domain-containing protein [Candidatus Omnitrophota bacterium]MCK5287924.1 nucleotidyltransferase domain-containing protein [Candidatus Omnitrophota bacterium]